MSYTPTEAEIEAVRLAILKLPRRQRDIFIARIVDKRSYDAIAASTGLSRDAIERQLVRAFINLDRLVHGYRVIWWHWIL